MTNSTSQLVKIIHTNLRGDPPKYKENDSYIFVRCRTITMKWSHKFLSFFLTKDPEMALGQHEHIEISL
jgi:hypothetical protein